MRASCRTSRPTGSSPWRPRFVSVVVIVQASIVCMHVSVLLLSSENTSQLYCVTLNMNDLKDIDATRQVTAWLADKQQGLAHVLANILQLHGVRPDLSRLALAGHSRGGDTAFAVALGLGPAASDDDDNNADAGTSPAALPLKFSALIGVDPVAGLSKQAQVEPKVLTFRPRSLDPGMPALVVGTGLGPKHVGGPPCAPAGVNHAEFYDECAPPRYHVVLRDYGHMDMLDDDGVPYVINNCMCMRNTKDTKDLARRAIGGAVVAFLRATLEDDDEDLKVVLENRPGLSPAVLDPVGHDLA
uniref:Chlorophyllase n=1 Tax=Zea mays TaxID=4577 RepID=C0PCL0_MAIZE|nr:unknown [Zea mays]